MQTPLAAKWLKYLPLFEQDLTSTANYITNILKNEDAALRLIDGTESRTPSFPAMQFLKIVL